MFKISLSEILKKLELTVPSNDGFSDFTLNGFASVDRSGPDDVTFWTGEASKETGLSGNAGGISGGALSGVEAGLLFLPMSFEKACKDGVCSLLPQVRFAVPVENPYHSMVCFLQNFVEGKEHFEESRIDDGAQIHESAVVEGSVGCGAVIGPGCVVMKGAFVGEGCRLEANVTVYPHVTIGRDCVFQAGTVVGSRGFGFYEYEGRRRIVPHLAGVRIGDRCSFGANTVVAAGFVSPTVIGNDCHFDSFVQIAHNCVLGDNIFMAAQSGIAGSAVVEDDVLFAGGAQSTGHVTIGKGARIAAKAGVTKNVKAGSTVAGFPAEGIDNWRRSVVNLRLLGKKPRRLGR